MMKVLVIGKEGQVARSLAAAESPEGMAVVALGRPEIDLTEADTITKAIDAVAPQIVVNAGAYTAVDKAETEPELAGLINATGSGHLAAVCSERTLPLIHLSTDYVFDGKKNSPYNERDLVAPVGVYGRSKLEGERLVAKACPCHVILRTAWVFSPYGHNFVKTMLRLASSRKELGIVDDQQGNPTYAPHLAEVILAIAARLAESNRDGGPWGIYHSVGTGEATWCELAREVFRCSENFGGPTATVNGITTAEYPTAAARPANSRLECTKLQRDYGLRLPDWRKGVADCVCKLLAGE
jgi:dTDP-4-dehydrorhamnose reductase